MANCRRCGESVRGDLLSKDDHLQRHISSKQFWCPVCSFNSVQVFRAKQHVHSAHPDQKVSAFYCNLRRFILRRKIAHLQIPFIDWAGIGFLKYLGKLMLIVVTAGEGEGDYKG